MSIASEITKLNSNLTDSYTACNTKGASMPSALNFDNLPDCIDSIQTGGGGIGIPREVVNGVYQMPSSNFTFSLPSNVTSLNPSVLQYAFYQCSTLVGVDLSNLTGLSSGALTRAFYQCTNTSGTLDLSGLTSIVGGNAMQYAFYQTRFSHLDLSSLTTISGSNALNYAFSSCRFESIDLSSLTTISGGNAMSYAFNDNNKLTSIDLSSITTVSGSNAMSYAFAACPYLTSVDLSGLTTVSGNSAFYYTFSSSTGLTSVDFSNLDTIGINASTANNAHFSNAFNSSNSLTSITFPKLEKIYCTGSNQSHGTFYYNNKVQKFYFPKLDTITYGTGASSTNQNACKYIFYGCSSLTEIHFGAANQSAIEASPGYSTAWGRGAGNVTIYFDL